jgi:hypothetical protein
MPSELLSPFSRQDIVCQDHESFPWKRMGLVCLGFSGQLYCQSSSFYDNKGNLLKEQVSDCCLMPSELLSPFSRQDIVCQDDDYVPFVLEKPA